MPTLVEVKISDKEYLENTLNYMAKEKSRYSPEHWDMVWKQPFELGALEPVMSEEMMGFNQNQHKTFVNNLNVLTIWGGEVLEFRSPDSNERDMARAKEIAEGLRFDGGGHINNAFFWESLAPIADVRTEWPTSESKLR